MGNRCISRFTGLLYGTTLTDIETGYKIFSRGIAQSLRLSEDSFGIEAEITAQVCRRKLRITEVPISYTGRTYAEGKKVTWRDGFRAIYVLVTERAARGRPVRTAAGSDVASTAPSRVPDPRRSA